MSGFGDGRPFDGWIADHIRRRDGLGRDDYLAQARAGVAEQPGRRSDDDRRLLLRGHRGRRGRARPGCARSSTWRLSAATMCSTCRSSGGSSNEPRPTGHGRHLASCPVHGRPSRLPPLVGAGPRAGDARRHPPARGQPGRAPGRVLPRRPGPGHGAIHAVKADADDIALFAELGVPVVHCPRSNALLGCGIAPVPALREAGVRVAPGHRLAGLRADPRHVGRDAGRDPAGPGGRTARPDVLTAGDVLRMATCEGAAALGLPDGLGTLRPGPRRT